MDFPKLMEQYMVNSSCSEHQAAFIWNAAIQYAQTNLVGYGSDVSSILEEAKVQIPVVHFEE